MKLHESHAKPSSLKYEELHVCKEAGPSFDVPVFLRRSE